MVRVDSIEDVLRAAGAPADLADLGYRVAYAVAEDNLLAGRIVIADSVNPIAITRDAWHEVARRVGVAAVDVEIRCADLEEHRRRVKARCWPPWQDVLDRRYEPLPPPRVVIDTAGRSVHDCLQELLKECFR